ncbi:helix-turn-helix domain-containing protein [Hymenobacter nivis]|uniref:HTH cro/C1-type domain-containing protein n=1 Tax=Hymenobacter nivis TaxID=1850093 RepID=A0A2Z3GQE2_9BACT|nr:helix-turn-helix transcriptional regulator [Hymenobacter nivis]AWM31604.1 hypothetical protein DDQ68_01640 [Hymenobacter nivis]
MARRAAYSSSPLAVLRRHFGLPQDTLAAFLRVAPAQLSRLEAGHRTLSAAVVERLLPLLQTLPDPAAPPAAAEADDPAAHLAPPDAAPLATRLAQCQHQARQLRRELAAITTKLETARRWQQALPPLLATAADAPARAWLLRRREQAAADLDGETAARYHLLRLRAGALEAEAAGLAALLSG